MPDRTDELNLPLYSESGNVDKGHLSELAGDIEAQQSQDLENILESYYNENIGFVDLQTSIRELGYSESRVSSISQASHEERVYRVQNQGQDSGLASNQLQALAEGGVQLTNNPVRTDSSGRQYVEDHRVREPDGTASRFYLPAPRQFNPLTIQQQAQVNYLEQVREDITIIPDSTTGENVELSQDQRDEIMRLATNYLNSDPDFRDARNLEFRNNVQHIEGIGGVTDINNVLFDLFVDIDQEYAYREQNNGLPQNMTREQYDFLRANPNLGYYGQPILRSASGVMYYTTRDRGKTPLITMEQINVERGIPQITGFDMTPTPTQENELNFLLADWLSGDITDEDFDNRVREITEYDPTDPARDPFKADMYNNFMYSLRLYDSEKQYREINDGRPSQLTELQYNFLINHQLLEGEERYQGQPLTIDRGVARFFTSDGNLMLVPTEEQIQGFVDNGIFTPSYQLPSTNPIDIRVDPDRTITDDDLHGRIPRLPNRVVPPSNEDIRDIVSGRTQFDPEDPLGLGDITPASPDIILPSLPPTPIQTDIGTLNIPSEIILPEETPSYQVENPFVERYVNYVNSYESLYVGFRNTFRDMIVPTAFSAAGAIVGYGFGVARSRLFIYNVYSDMERQLHTLDSELNALHDRDEELLDNLETLRDQKDVQIDLLIDELEETGQAQTQEGYDLLDTLNELRGLLAGTEDDPDADPEFLRDEIYGSFGVAQALLQSNAELARLQEEMTELTELSDSIEETIAEIEIYQDQLFDVSETRDRINEGFTDVLNDYFTDMYKVYKYRNEINIGVGLGNSVGVALSSVLTGYIMPTAISNEEDIPIPSNLKRESLSDIRDTEKRNKRKYNMILKGRFDPLTKLKTSQYNPAEKRKDFNKEYERDNLELVQPKTIDTMSQKILPKTDIPFRIIKDNGNKPLDYKQIQEYKSTLSKSELQELKNQYLIFGDGGEVLKVQDKCRGVYQDQSKVGVRKIGFR